MATNLVLRTPVPLVPFDPSNRLYSNQISKGNYTGLIRRRSTLSTMPFFAENLNPWILTLSIGLDNT